MLRPCVKTSGNRVKTTLKQWAQTILAALQQHSGSSQACRRRFRSILVALVDEVVHDDVDDAVDDAVDDTVDDAVDDAGDDDGDDTG